MFKMKLSEKFRLHIGEIEISSLQRSKRKPTENMTSYEYLLRGKEKHHHFKNLT